MTSDQAEPDRPKKRRRRRAGAPQGAPPAASDLPASPPAPVKPAAHGPQHGQRRQRRPRDGGEHGTRDLAGAGSTQVDVSAALRARDVNRPTDEDLAAAERDVTIVRRNWRPPR